MVVWRLMFGLTVAAIVLMAWTTADRLAEPEAINIPVGIEASDEPSYAEALSHAPPDEPPFDDTLTEDGTPDRYEPYDEAEYSDPAGEAPIADDGDLLDRRARSERADLEPPAYSDEPVEPNGDLDDLLHDAPDPSLDEDLEPTAEIEVPWDATLRHYSWISVVALLGALLLFVGIRERDLRHGLAGGFLGGLAILAGLAGLTWSGPTDELLWAITALQQSVQVFVPLAFFLLALGAPRRPGLLSGLVVGAELVTALAWWSRSAGAELGVLLDPLVPALAFGVTWGVGAWLFAQRAYSRRADAGEPSRGPYRSAAEGERGGASGSSVELASRLAAVWIGAQLLLALTISLRLVRSFELAPYQVAIDVGIAAVLTIEARRARPGAERGLWRQAAGLLWVPASLAVVGHTVETYASYAMVPSPGPLPRLAAALASMAFAAGAGGLLVRAMHASTEADRSARGERTPARPSVVEIGCVVAGAAAARWLALTRDIGGAMWLVLAGLVLLGVLTFLRLRRRLRQPVLAPDSADGAVTDDDADRDDLEGANDEDDEDDGDLAT